MTFSHKNPVHLVVFAVVLLLLVLGGLNTWHYLSLHSKVQFLAEHQLPASLALTEDWVTAPSLVVWNGLEASK